MILQVECVADAVQVDTLAMEKAADPVKPATIGLASREFQFVVLKGWTSFDLKFLKRNSALLNAHS
jgi:hypothetical protein